MSMTAVPFDYTLPARYRDRVTHYLEYLVSGDDCNDVFSPVPYNLPPVFSADLLTCHHVRDIYRLLSALNDVERDICTARNTASSRSWWSGLTGRTPE
ncbi:TPA: hypothetical protein JFV33_004912 [Salmonella enterica]|nr:hypothetical protein [Salmonella enterica]